MERNRNERKTDVQRQREKGSRAKECLRTKEKEKGVKEYKGEGKGKRNERNERQWTRFSMLSLW